jgi:glucan biosynthesis protein C
METNQTPGMQAERLEFFDYLRLLMVLFVLIFHSAASYGTIVGFWPFHDAHPTEVVDILMILLDAFMMGILFFIGGYFCLPSLRKRGGGRFLADKFRRLGIPWLLVIVFVLPVLDYAHYTARSVEGGLEPRGYAAHWWLSMLRFARLDTGPMRMSEYLDMSEHFYQRYMWFLSLLLLFFVASWLLYEAWEKWGRTPAQPATGRAPSARSIRIALLAVGLLTVVLFAPIYWWVSPNPIKIVGSWFSLGNLIQFQPAKLVFYASYFGLGVYAYAKGWFTGGADLGRPWAWGVACLLLMVANMLVARSIARFPAPSIGLHLAFVVLYPFWTLSFLGLFTAFAYRRWNRGTALSRDLAAHSYNLYLVHYVFVMTLPPLLGRWTGGPTLLKFGLVALLTFLLSYGASRYLLKPHPRLVAIGLVGVSILLAVLT